MGFGVADIRNRDDQDYQNENGIAICQGGTVNAHQTSIGLDSDSPFITKVQWASLHANSGTETGFGDAINAIGGTLKTWFLSLPVTHRVLLRLRFVRG